MVNEMRINILTAVLCGMVLVATRVAVSENLDIKKLPEEEQALANTVDPWGLAFSDQLADARAAHTGAEYAD